jgi:pheromone shutdown protein TraB
MSLLCKEFGYGYRSAAWWTIPAGGFAGGLIGHLITGSPGGTFAWMTKKSPGARWGMLAGLIVAYFGATSHCDAQQVAAQDALDPFLKSALPK